MLGAIAGDIIGSPFEWSEASDRYFELCRTQRGWYKGREVNYHPRFTDDSVMTLAVAKWLVQDETRSTSKLASIMKQMCGEYIDKGFSKSMRQWVESSNPSPSPYDSLSEITRVSPIGLKEPNLADVIRLARETANLTTSNPESINATEAMAQAVWMARHGRSKEDIKFVMERDFGLDLSKDTFELSNLLSGYIPEPIIVNGEDTGQYYMKDTGRISTSSSIYVSAALTAFLQSDGFEDAVRRGVSLGGHSDTIGSLVGAISEPFYGGVPEKITGLCEKYLDSNIERTMKSFELIGQQKNQRNGHIHKRSDDSFGIIKCGDRKVFVIASDKKDILQAVKAKFGQDVEVVTPNKAGKILSELSSTKSGTYIEDPRPDYRTIYFQQGEFRNTVTMEGQNLPSSEDRKAARVEFLSISDYANHIKSELQASVGYDGSGSIHFASAYYPEIFHDRVEMWKGDLFAGAVGIDPSTGLLRIYEGNDLGLNEYGIGRTENVFTSLNTDQIKESLGRFCLDQGIGIFDKDRTLNLHTANDDVAKSTDMALSMGINDITINQSNYMKR